MGWPDKNISAIPTITEPLIEKTPAIGITVGGFLIGLNWIIKRRMELTKQNDKTNNQKKKESNDK